MTPDEIIKAARLLPPSPALFDLIAAYEEAVKALETEAVPMEVYKQVVWERDTAVRQLKNDYGVEPGEAKKDTVKRGRWENNGDDDCWKCSECGEEQCCFDFTPEELGLRFCPGCGARMDGRVRKGSKARKKEAERCRENRKENAWRSGI